MAQYLGSFIVYTLAMIGILIIAYVVYKKTVLANPINKNSLLKIVDMMRLPDRKTLYVIKCKDELFLIASSNEKVTLISKLNEQRGTKNLDIEKYLSEKREMESTIYEGFQQEETKAPNKRVIKSLLKELSDKNRTKRGNY